MLAFFIMSDELSIPNIYASGKKLFSTAVEFPGPHPISMIRWALTDCNLIAKSIEGCVQNKKGNGICGYLSSSYYKRAKFDSSAVISALVALLNKDKNYRELDIELNKNYTVKKKITNGSKCVKW